MADHEPQAWSGTEGDFRAAVEAVRANTDVESDNAVLVDVILVARDAATMRAERDRYIDRVRLLESRLEAIRGALTMVTK